MQINSLLVAELDPLSVGMCVEGVHQDKGNVAIVLVVDKLKQMEMKSESLVHPFCAKLLNGQQFQSGRLFVPFNIIRIDIP